MWGMKLFFLMLIGIPTIAHWLIYFLLIAIVKSPSYTVCLLICFCTIYKAPATGRNVSKKKVNKKLNFLPCSSQKWQIACCRDGRDIFYVTVWKFGWVMLRKASSANGGVDGCHSTSLLREGRCDFLLFFNVQIKCFEAKCPLHVGSHTMKRSDLQRRINLINQTWLNVRLFMNVWI